MPVFISDHFCLICMKFGNELEQKREMCHFGPPPPYRLTKKPTLIRVKEPFPVVKNINSAEAGGSYENIFVKAGKI